MLRLKTTCLAALTTLMVGMSSANAVQLYYPYPNLAPTEDAKSFAAGNLGTLASTYDGLDLIVAWRVLTLHTVSAQDQKWVSDANAYEMAWASSEYYAWQTARNEVLGTPSKGAIINADAPDFMCKADAFKQATTRLKKLSDQYGQHNPDVMNWAQGQDAVFSNCVAANPGTRPEDALANAPEWLRQDRLYQQASAAFYAQDFDQARTLFGQVAEDKTSPYSTIATYLVGRTFLQKAEMTQTGPDTPTSDQFAQAQTALNSLSSTASQKDQAQLNPLARRAAYEMNPEAELMRIEAAISTRDWTTDTVQDLKDYLYAIHYDLNNAKGNPFRRTLIELVPKGGMTDWIYTVQGLTGSNKKPLGESFEGTVAIWRSNPSPQWLLAALMTADSLHAVPPDMLDAATAVTSASPAYAAIQYNLLRLRDKNLQTLHVRHPGPLPLDRALENDAQHLLTTQGQLFPGRDANLLHQLVAEHTTNACTFFKHAWMHAPEEGGGNGGGSGFATEFADDLNTHMSVDTLAKLWDCHSGAADAQSGLTTELWIRSALLKRNDLAKKVNDAFVAAHPKLRSKIDAYWDADDADKPYRLSRLLLADHSLTAQMQDVEWSNYGALTPWRPTPYAQDDTTEQKEPGLLFLSATDVKQASHEMDGLKPMRSGVQWVGTQVIEHVHKHPFDFSNPSAVADVVAASKYADATSTSRAAFRLLHRWYRFTGAAHETKYYY